ncbi:FAD-dependent oxidoreductase [Actinoplanes sp. NPDC051343]|uniref:FAD-dependent oxidoreductase n=1 Tax=Actinoplanes sp. NPDC051343 TaxID=3363906 RepID=UPI0037958D05
MALSAITAFTAIGAVDPPDGQKTWLDTVVVLGGSIAGLLAARILSDHANRVLVVEWDDVRGGRGPRRGVPHGAQAHALLAGGARQLERWFPGFITGAVADGALIATAQQRLSYLDGMAKVHFPAADMLTTTRPFLEDQIRRRVLSLPNVNPVAGRAVGLEFSATAVTGVRILSDSIVNVVKSVDLVVDAMGRSSRLSDWLTSAGWDRPRMTRRLTGTNYATATFRRKPGLPPWNGVMALYSGRVGGDLAGATFSAVEDDRWIVMMSGYGDCRPGFTPNDMVGRCRRDFPREFGEVVDGGMTGSVAVYRQADSRRRDFAAAGRFPARLLAIGDSVASFNPIYGQGISSAALHASCLSLFLHSDPDLYSPARQFFALQQVIVDAAWEMSTSADLSRPSVVMPWRMGYRLANWLSGVVGDASITDPEVSRRFGDAAHMLRHPRELVEPRLIARALLARCHSWPEPSPSFDDISWWP